MEAYKSLMYIERIKYFPRVSKKSKSHIATRPPFERQSAPLRGLEPAGKGDG